MNVHPGDIELTIELSFETIAYHYTYVGSYSLQK